MQLKLGTCLMFMLIYVVFKWTEILASLQLGHSVYATLQWNISRYRPRVYQRSAAARSVRVNGP